MSEVKTRANILLQEASEVSLERIAATLRELGLSGYAASAFCALVRTSEAAAGDLVLKTGIPDSKIYYALEELVEKGLVEVQAGKPRTYRVVPLREVETCLQRMLDTKYERERTAIKRVTSLLEPLHAATTSPSVDIAYIIKGIPNIISRARTMIASARQEIVFLASEEDFIRKIEPDLVKVAQRRVKVKLAIPEIGIEKDLERMAEIRSIVCSCLIVVVDGQQVLMVSRHSEGSTYGITSTDETLVRLAQEYWESPRCCVKRE